MSKIPKTIRSRRELAAYLKAERQAGKTIGFVPTMGALHAGHLSLVRRAGAMSECVVASIFVNPTQFAPGEDLETYPRQEEVDLRELQSAGCDVVYIPTVAEMYPEGLSLIHISEPTRPY